LVFGCGIIRDAALCELCRHRHNSHSTGHSSRLDRKLDTAPKPFGSPDYGKEELVAEMSAAFLCSYAGIQPTVIENQAAYLAGWLKQLKSDKKLVVSAAGQAQRAADWIRGDRPRVQNVE
jgi:antirestriction protein ArdC